MQSDNYSIHLFILFHNIFCVTPSFIRVLTLFRLMQIIGLNNNSYQLQRCRDITKEARLTNLEWLQVSAQFFWMGSSPKKYQNNSRILY